MLKKLTENFEQVPETKQAIQPWQDPREQKRIIDTFGRAVVRKEGETFAARFQNSVLRPFCVNSNIYKELASKGHKTSDGALDGLFILVTLYREYMRLYIGKSCDNPAILLEDSLKSAGYKLIPPLKEWQRVPK